MARAHKQNKASTMAPSMPVAATAPPASTSMTSNTATDASAAAASASKSSRLFVQNLPAYLDSNRLREHFATKGEVTDAVVIRTKDSKTSRRFGFVGYKSLEQAHAACAFFHQSFLDTCRINVRFAIQRESEEMARPWSKYSVGSSRFKETSMDAKQTAQSAETDEQPPADSKKSKQPKAPVDENSAEFKQFMETMQARSKTRFWANDDGEGPEAQAKAEAAALLRAADSDDDDDEYQELQQKRSDDDDNDDAKTKKNDMSDLDFLRSKVSKTIDNDDDDAQSDAGSDKQYAEAIEDDDENENDAPAAARTSSSRKSNAAAANAQRTSDDATSEPTKPTSRLFVRNLPFTAEEEDLMDLFAAHGPIVEVHMPLDDTKRRKGFGFVLFKNPVDAQAALMALDGFAFQGRLLHVFFAKMKPEKSDPEQLLQDPNLTYKQKKELERQLAASKQTGWNASFIRGDATVGSLATRMGVKRGDIMDKEHGNMAVRLAIGETMLVKENKDFFADEGVDLNAIEGALVKPGQKAASAAANHKVERSTTVILIKNLPHTTDEDELAQLFRKHGDIGRFLLPPSKTLALVEFFEPTEARKAFRSLAYKKYQHVPLYLEWAPVKVFSSAAKPAATEDAKGIKKTAAVPDVQDDENAADANNTVCVKNLSFATQESALEKLFQRCGKLRKVTVARRKDPKRGMLSMGFGFVEFEDAKHAETAIKSLQSTVLDGHALNLKISQKKVAPKRRAPGDTDETTGRQTKIIARNVAFEATSNEIRELFGAFGQLKRVRMPKKFDGKHRGFAFVEFLTEQEAQSAFAALASSHLYGRHLVLEWAEDADDIDTLRAKATKDLSAINDSERRKRLKRDDDDEDMEREGEY